MSVYAQIFLHVVGAVTLFGATGAVAVLSLSARGKTEQLPLARTSFWTLLVLALPAWVVTVVLGTTAKSARGWPDHMGWLDLGATIADAGLLVLLATTFLAFRWKRNPVGGWQVTAISVLSSLLLVALGVAWWVMTTKTPI